MSQKLKLLVIVCLVSLFLLACTNDNQYDNGQDYETDDTVINEYEEPEDEHVIVIEYWDNRLVEFNSGHIEEVMYYALGRYGEYFFVTGDDWTEEFMQRMIAVSEEGIKFARDWLGYDGDTRIIGVYGIYIRGTPQTNPYSVMQRGLIGGYFFTGEIFLNIPKEMWPWAIVHEAVHAILNLQGRVSNFPRTPETSPLHILMFLEEGLCDLIEFLFSLETEHPYTINFTQDEEFTTANLHKWAIDQFEFSNNFEDEARYGLIYPQLMSHRTAASFIYYLVTYRGTIEDFNRVFDDINLMEGIYGMSMGDMIVEWMEYLEQFR